jgi:hypothetical protein
MYTERLRNVHKKGVYVGYVDIVDVCDAYTVCQFLIGIWGQITQLQFCVAGRTSSVRSVFHK